MTAWKTNASHTDRRPRRTPPTTTAITWLAQTAYSSTSQIHKSQRKHLYLILMFWSHHEIFLRRSWYSVLPSLDATISCRIKKAVVGVTQLTGSRWHCGTTGIHHFHYVFHTQRPTLQTEVWYRYGKSSFSFGGQYVHGTLRRETAVNSTIRIEALLWKRHVDDILEVMKKGSVEKLTEFLNCLDATRSTKFTYEVEQDGKLPFLDILLERTDSGGLKLCI